MRHLIDPYESLGGKYLPLLVIVGALVIIGAGNVGLSFLLPARLANPAIVILMLCCVCPLIRKGMTELKDARPMEGRRFGAAVVILLVIFAVGTVASFHDLRGVNPEQHLGWSRPVVAETHGFRILSAIITLTAVYGACMLVWRSRFVSWDLAKGGSCK